MKIAFKRARVKIWPFRTLKLFLNINENKIDSKVDPFLNTILAQYQVDLNEFINEFNLYAKQLFLDNIELPVIIIKTPELAEFSFKFPTFSWLVSQTLQFDAENSFDQNLNVDYFEKKFNFFFTTVKVEQNLDIYKVKRISIPYILLWDIAWWLAELKFLKLNSAILFLIGTFRSLRCFIRIEKVLPQFGIRNCGFFNSRQRALKIGKKKLRFKFLIYRFYRVKKLKKKIFFFFLSRKKKTRFFFFLKYFFNNLSSYQDEDQEILPEVIISFKNFSVRVKKKIFIILIKKIKKLEKKKCPLLDN